MRFLGVLGVLLSFACGPGEVVVIDDVPSPSPGAPAVARSAAQTFAIDAILLGDTDRHGTASADAWQWYGYDLDGLVTTATTEPACTLSRLASSDTAVDGNWGVDNSFAKSFWQTIGLLEIFSLYHTTTAEEVAAIHDGTFTVQLQTFGLDGQDDAANLSLHVLASGPYDDGAPAFDPMTDWPVLDSSLVDASTLESGALVRYDDAYVTHGTFVSGTPSASPVPVPILIAGVPAILRVHHAVITFEPTGDQLLNGTIAGVLDPTELGNVLAGTARRLFTFACSLPPSSFDVTAMQDIMQDGTSAPSEPCNGISFGVGFTARRVANPTKVSPEVTQTLCN